MYEQATIKEHARHWLNGDGRGTAISSALSAFDNGLVERRSAELHVQRMLQQGEAVEVEPDRFQRTS